MAERFTQAEKVEDWIQINLHECARNFLILVKLTKLSRGRAAIINNTLIFVTTAQNLPMCRELKLRVLPI